MKNIFYILILIAVGSCTKQIPFDDPGTEQKLVINSLIEPNDSITAEISVSASILRPGDVNVLTTATVSLYENGTLIGNLEPDDFDIYGIDHAPVEGKEYELVASETEYGTASSTTSVPSAIVVSNITVEQTLDLNDQTIYRVEFDLDDPSGDNFYILHVVQSYPDVAEQWDQSFTSTEPYFLGGSQDNYFWSGAAFRDDAFDGQKQRMTVDLDYLDTSQGSTYSILLISATEEHFLYHVSYKAYQDSNGDPFSQPVQIYSNVDNGLGIFAGHNKTWTEIPY